MAVGQQKVDAAVIIIVEIFQPPAAEQTRNLRDAMRVGQIGECLVMIVAIEREHLLVDVGHEEVLPTIAIQVRGIDAHPRSSLPALAEPNARLKSDLFPLDAALAIFAPIYEKIVLDSIVADEKVHATIVIDVRGDYT